MGKRKKRHKRYRKTPEGQIPAWKHLVALYERGEMAEVLNAINRVDTGSDLPLTLLNLKAAAAVALGEVEVAIDALTQWSNRDRTAVDPLANMAALLIAQEKNEEGLSLLLRAAELEPSNLHVLENLARLYLKVEKFPEVEVYSKKIAETAPYEHENYHRYLSSLYEQSKHEQVKQVLQSLPSSFGRLAELSRDFGARYLEEGHYDIAEALLTMAVSSESTAITYSNLGVCKRRLGKIEEAEATYRAGLKVDPREKPLNVNLGNLLIDSGRYVDAAECFETVISDHPENFEALIALGIAQRELGDIIKSQVCFSNAVALQPASADALRNLAATHIDLGEINAAHRLLQRALELKPEDRLTGYNFANVERMLGKRSAAISRYERIMEEDLNFTPCSYSWATAVEHPDQYERFRPRLESIWERDDIPEVDRAWLGFSLYEIYKAYEDYNRAAEYVVEANSLQKRLTDYSSEANSVFFKGLIQTNLETSVKLTQNPKKAFVPIFIVGMPRSGTTLVEQTISSHPSVAAAGEMPFMYQNFIKPTGDLRDVRDAAEVRENYIAAVAPRLGRCSHLTDKLPMNYMLLPRIASVFPEAKFIHVYRSPAATLWSNYERRFNGRIMDYSYDLEDLVTYYADYKAMMEAYSTELGGRIYQLSYEALTEALESVVADLFDYLELDAVAQVLEPHLNKRAVSTASLDQVRLPVYQGSSTGWMKFRKTIGSSFDTLEPFRRK